MRVLRSFVFLALACVLGLLSGCAANSTNRSLDTARTAIYNRAAAEFERALFYKPSETWTDDLGVKLAPLLLQENVETETTGKHFGTLISRNGAPEVDATRPTIYFQKDKIRLKGAERDQVVFLWFYPSPAGILPQGVRITLDSDEHPALWEILSDTTGLRQVFASQSLETAASGQFSAPLAGRQSALERAVHETPTVTVSRVISDGPLVMGPAIYLSAETHDVATLICRCMPPQARELLSTHVYEIAEMSDPAIDALVKQALQHSGGAARTWLNEGAEELEMRLRLPDRF